MKTLGRIKLFDELVDVKEASYQKGRGTAIVLETEHGEPYCTFSINIPGLELDEGEIAVKTWFEHEPLRQPMLDSGLFVDTGKRARTGHAVAEIWRLSAVAAQAAEASH